MTTKKIGRRGGMTCEAAIPTIKKPAPWEAAREAFHEAFRRTLGWPAAWESAAQAAIDASSLAAENEALKARVRELEQEATALVSFAALHPDFDDNSPMWQQAQRLRAALGVDMVDLNGDGEHDA